MRDNDAERNISIPPTTKTATIHARVLSMCGLRAMLAHQGKCNAHDGKDDREDPVTHRYFVAWPAQGLKVVVQGRNAEQFFLKHFFPKYLEHVRADRSYEKKCDQRQ